MMSVARRRRHGIAVMLGIVAVALTGCSPSSVAKDSYPGFPHGVDGDTLSIPQAFADDSTLYLTLGGSSSCPPVPTSISWDNNELVITVDHGWAIACTADIAATTYEFSLGSIPKNVEVVFDGDDRQKIAIEPL